jgi:hypothetical protein
MVSSSGCANTASNVRGDAADAGDWARVTLAGIVRQQRAATARIGRARTRVVRVTCIMSITSDAA